MHANGREVTRLKRRKIHQPQRPMHVHFVACGTHDGDVANEQRVPSSALLVQYHIRALRQQIGLRVCRYDGLPDHVLRQHQAIRRRKRGHLDGSADLPERGEILIERAEPELCRIRLGVSSGLETLRQLTQRAFRSLCVSLVMLVVRVSSMIPPFYLCEKRNRKHCLICM